jgi:hypothetical protein
MTKLTSSSMKRSRSLSDLSFNYLIFSELTFLMIF